MPIAIVVTIGPRINIPTQPKNPKSMTAAMSAPDIKPVTIPVPQPGMCPSNTNSPADREAARAGDRSHQDVPVPPDPSF